MTRPVLIQRRYFQFFIPWLLPLIFAQADFSISPFHYRIWDSGDEMSQDKSEEEDTCFLKIKQSSRCLFNTSWWEAPVGCADPTSRRWKAKTSPSLDPPWIPVGRRFTVLPLWVPQLVFFFFPSCDRFQLYSDNLFHPIRDLFNSWWNDAKNAEPGWAA